MKKQALSKNDATVAESAPVRQRLPVSERLAAVQGDLDAIIAAADAGEGYADPEGAARTPPPKTAGRFKGGVIPILLALLIGIAIGSVLPWSTPKRPAGQDAAVIEPASASHQKLGVVANALALRPNL